MSQDNDELARRLAAMSEGAAAPDEAQHAQEPAHDQVDLNPRPATQPPPNAPRMIFPDSGAQTPPRATPQPKPFLRPVPPPPTMPASPSPASPRPTSPHQAYYTPPTPSRQPVAPQPMTAPAEMDDDAVIVPAPDPAVFAHRPAPRPPVRLHRVQTLEFKRTIIPILLTLGVICPTLAITGFLAPSTSPLSVLRSGWFAGPFVLIGLLNLALAVITMLQVKHELEHRQRDTTAPANVR